MNTTVEDRIRRAAMQLDEAVEERARRQDVAYLGQGAAPSRSWRPVQAAAAAVLVVAAAVAVVAQRSGRDNALDAPVAQRIGGAEGWESLPEAPLSGRFQHVAVAGHTGVLFWGGYAPGGPKSDGAYFDATTHTWTKAPRAPLASGRGDAVGAWTGTEAVVVNGIDGTVEAAAYNPRTNNWRKLSDPPLSNAANMMTTATVVGRSIVVVAVSEEGERGQRNEVAVFDIDTSTWRIGNPPTPSFGSGFDAVAVGDEVVVVARRGLGGMSCGEAVVMAYRPAQNAWRALDGSALATVIPAAVAATGNEVFVVGGTCGHSEAARQALLLDVAAGTWRTAADAPVGVRGDIRYDEVFTGREVVTFDADTTPVFYDPASDTWRIGQAHPLGRRLMETPWAWVAGRLIHFGGGITDEGAHGWCCPALQGGYAYVPAA